MQWRAVDHEGEVVEVFVTKRRDRRAALEFLTRAMKRYGRPASIVRVGSRFNFQLSFAHTITKTGYRHIVLR